MRLFLDTDGLIDHALEKQTGQPLEIAYILFKARKDRIPVFISPGSLYTFVYIMNKNGIRGTALCAKLDAYLSFLDVCVSDKVIFTESLAAGFKDWKMLFNIRAQSKHIATTLSHRMSLISNDIRKKSIL